MKVLQIINSLGAGGAEKLVVETTLLFIKKGIQADVLLLNGERTPLYEQLEKNSAVTIHTLKGNIYNPLNIFKIKSYFKNYDVIQAHLFPVSYWVSFAKMLSLNKVPVIFTEHNTTNRRRSKPLFKAIDKLVYSNFTKVITISKLVDQNLKDHLNKPDTDNKFIEIPNGIDLQVSHSAEPYTKEELGFSPSDTLLIQVSSFTPQKDQKTVVNALKLLPENIKLILVGHGPLMDDVKNYVAQENLENRVYFFGIRKDVPRLLKSVDIVVLSSHYEGLSLSCIEGMASGKPFVATNSPGLGDIVSGAGAVFEDENETQLSQLILNLLENEAFYNSTFENCLLRASEYDINKMVESYHNLYKNLV